MNIEEIINETVDKTILKLKMAGLLSDYKKTSFQKTEELLRNYNTFKTIADDEAVKKLVDKVDSALHDIESDIYYEIIPMIYFENETREYVAEHFHTSTKTIWRNKVRLINQLKIKLFTQDVIFELFS